MSDCSMRAFVDPRQTPQPTPEHFGLSTPDHSDVAELVRLCRSGRVYAVEEWIRSGRPLYATSVIARRRQPESALNIAVQSRQYDLALLLLCNGFPADPPAERLLSIPLRKRAGDFVELLLAWGADPLAVDAYEVLETYDSALYDRFWALGVDFTEGHALAFELARRSSNRPTYGWAKRNCGDPRVARELSIALCDAIEEDRERAVALLLWAGADPHTRVPSLRWYRDGEEEDTESHDSAVAAAIRSGKGKYLSKLKPNSELDDLGLLWSNVHDKESLDYLASVASPVDWSPIITQLIHRLSWGFRESSQIRQCLERVFTTYSGRLVTIELEAISNLRRAILRAPSDYEMLPVLRFLSKPEHCEPAIFEELMRTPSIRQKFGGRGLKGVPALGAARLPKLR